MTQPDLFSVPERRPAPNPVRDEVRRLTANAARVLERLQDGQWHTNAELMTVGGFRAVGRLFDLKQHGHHIERRHDHGGQWSYRLIQ